LLATRFEYSPGGILPGEVAPVNVVTNILFVILLVVSVIFVFVTTVFGSKSDAMSGGSSQIRTTYRGKPGFDDFMSKFTLVLGCIFMGLCLLIDILQQRFGSQ
jgi:protein translocase SecG subunit